MKVAELLPAKRLVSARRTKVAISVNSSGNSFWRSRLSLTTKDFEFLYGHMGATAPRSEIHGSADQGLILQVHEHGGVKINMQSRSSVVCTFSCREVGITENRVESVHVDAVLVEYDDKTRYLLTSPLPDQFLTSSVKNRRVRDAVPPLKAIELAYELAGGELPPTMRRRPAVHHDTPVQPAPTETTPAVTPVERPVVVAGTAVGEENNRPRSLDDLKEILGMLNEQAETLKASGVNVVLRIEEGVVKASVPVTVYQDL